MDLKCDGIWLKSFNQDGMNIGTRAGMLHRSMTTRVTKPHALDARVYLDCVIADEFKDFQFFAGWCQDQIGYNNLDKNANSWQLDKDIVEKGNRVYGPDSCIFLPNDLNTMIRVWSNKKSGLPPGVSYHKTKKKFTCNCNDANGVPTSLGLYRSAEESFSVYKEFKENVIKQMANRYKDQIDLRAYESLMVWTIEINDH